MDEDIRPPITSREEIQEFFKEEQKLEEIVVRKRVAQASKEAQEAVRRTALNSANIVGMVNSEDGMVMDWMYRTLPPQNSQVEVIVGGGPKPGGGSKSKRKKSKKGNKVYMDPWSGI